MLMLVAASCLHGAWQRLRGRTCGGSQPLMANIRTLIITMYGSCFNSVPTHLIPPAVQHALSPLATVLRMCFLPVNNTVHLFVEFLSHTAAKEVKSALDENPSNPTYLKMEWAKFNLDSFINRRQTRSQRGFKVEYRRVHDDSCQLEIVNCFNGFPKFNAYHPWQ